MNRTVDQDNYSFIKRMVRIFTTINFVEGVTPTATVMKWNYPTLGVGVNARTYTAATSGTLPAGAAYPLQYQYGAEGVFGITRTAVGLYTLKLQDNYQRLVDLNAYAASAGGATQFAKVTENTTISNYTGAAVAQNGSVIGLAFWDFANAAVDPIGQVRIALVLCDATES